MFMYLILFTSNSLYHCLLYNQEAGTTKSFCGREFLIRIILSILNLLLPQNICNGFLLFLHNPGVSMEGLRAPAQSPVLVAYKLNFPSGESINLLIPLPGCSSVQSPLSKELSKGMFPSLYLQNHGTGCKSAVHVPLALVMA